jgi:hypothetical protein
MFDMNKPRYNAKEFGYSKSDLEIEIEEGEVKMTDYTDYTEIPYAEDFELQLGKLVDDLMREGMATETAIMVMRMIIDDLTLCI